MKTYVYTETMSVLNQDLRSFRVRPGPNLLPPGVAAGVVYQLPAWGAADLARLRAAADAEAVNERAARGLAGPGAPVAAVSAAVAPPAPALQAADADEEPPGIKSIAVGATVWLAAETVGSVKYGDVIQGVAIAATVGARTIHGLPDGQQVFCIGVSQGQVEDFNARPSSCDARIVKIKNNAVGTPERPLAEIIAETKEYRVGWKLSGPRTSRWCLNYLVIEGLGFEAHHERFRQLCKLEPTTWGAMEHFQLSMVLIETAHPS